MSKNIYWATNSAPILPCWGLHSFNLFSLNEPLLLCCLQCLRQQCWTTFLSMYLQSKNLCISSVQGDL